MLKTWTPQFNKEALESDKRTMEKFSDRPLKLCRVKMGGADNWDEAFFINSWRKGEWRGIWEW